MIHDSRQSDNGLSPPPPDASHLARTFHVLSLLKANRFEQLVPLATAARQLRLPVAKLMNWRLSVARIREGKVWYTSRAELDRLTAIFLPAEGNR